MKDISENYYVPSETKKSNKESVFDKQIPRFTDIPIIFSVNGFDTHSENLAWAQGINLVSHKGIPIFDNIIKLIDELSENIKDFCSGSKKESDCINIIKLALYNIDISNINSFHEFRRKLSIFLKDENEDLYKLHKHYHFWFYGQVKEKIYELAIKLKNINTFIIATTEKGTVLNLVSEESFPIEYFQIENGNNDNAEYNPNRAQVGVYFEQVGENNQERVFYFQFNRNAEEDQRRFYFQPNKQMLSDQFPELSEQKRIDLKKEFVGILTFIYEIDRVNRVLELEVKFPYETRKELNKMIDVEGEK